MFRAKVKTKKDYQGSIQHASAHAGIYINTVTAEYESLKAIFDKAELLNALSEYLRDDYKRDAASYKTEINHLLIILTTRTISFCNTVLGLKEKEKGGYPHCIQVLTDALNRDRPDYREVAQAQAELLAVVCNLANAKKAAWMLENTHEALQNTVTETTKQPCVVM